MVSQERCKFHKISCTKLTSLLNTLIINHKKKLGSRKSDQVLAGRRLWWMNGSNEGPSPRRPGFVSCILYRLSLTYFYYQF